MIGVLKTEFDENIVISPTFIIISTLTQYFTSIEKRENVSVCTSLSICMCDVCRIMCHNVLLCGSDSELQLNTKRNSLIIQNI